MTNVASLRLDDALRSALGPHVASILNDPLTTDLMRNADGRLWVDHLEGGRVDTGRTMSNADATATLGLLAHSCGVPLTRHSPVISTTLPISGERIAGTIPPVTASPTFAIRKPPSKVFGLEAFAAFGSPSVSPECTKAQTSEETTECDRTNIMSGLINAVQERRNILICGSTGSGKTSLASSLLNLASVSSDRVLLLEDTTELQCCAEDQVRFVTTPDVDMHALVRLSLRYRPDRIIVGELRDGATAMAYLGALNTGHGGGICTLHANSASDALMRMESLCSEVCVTIPTRQIRSAIDAVCFVQRTATGRAIKEMVYVS